MNYENTELCTKCRGECCKRMACHFAPCDFRQPITKEYLAALLQKGNIAIDYWEGDIVEPKTIFDSVNRLDRIYYLRMRHVGEPICYPSYGGRCVLLTKRGCSLPLRKRPKGARALEPKYNKLTEEYECVSHYTKREAVVEWRKYQGILSELWEEFSGKVVSGDV